MQKNTRGFTLLEVLAAVAILSIALLVLFRGQTRSMANVLEVQDYERALFITENQLHWTWIDLNEATAWQEYASLNGEDGDFRWQVQIEPTQAAAADGKTVTLLRVMASTTWPKGQAEGHVALESYYLWGEEDQ